MFEYLKLSDVEFYQCKINKGIRLIFTINENNLTGGESVFIPLLLDLNHVIYRDETYDSNFKSLNYKWDLKSEQNFIKQELLDSI